MVEELRSPSLSLSNKQQTTNKLPQRMFSNTPNRPPLPPNPLNRLRAIKTPWSAVPVGFVWVEKQKNRLSLISVMTCLDYTFSLSNDD